MAVREFNGTTDYLRLSIGGLGAAAYGTYAALYKVVDTAALRALFCFLNSSQAFVWAPFLIDSNDTMIYHGTSDVSIAAPPQAIWVTMVVRKATGTATPRFSYYNHDTTTWTHSNASGTTGNGTAPTSGFINVNTAGTAAGGEVYNGRIAVTAAWSNTVKWSADGTGDSEIETAGLHTSLANWVTAAPDSLWPYDPAVGAGIVDLIGTAHENAISGTTLINGDDPPGFTFDLESPPELEAGPQVNVTRSNNRWA